MELAVNLLQTAGTVGANSLMGLHIQSKAKIYPENSMQGLTVGSGWAQGESGWDDGQI